MGFFDKIKGQFIDVIEWVDSTNDTLIWKFPRYDNEIKNGAQLIVRESQVAVFMYEGEFGDVFPPGRYELTTANIPILTTLESWKYAFDAPFKCDIYFVATRQFTDLKWGTKNPVMMRDAELGAIRLRAFGSYCIRVSDPKQFIQQIAGTDTLFQTTEITGQLRNILASRFADAVSEAKIPALDLAANYNEMGEMLRQALKGEIAGYGVELTLFLIENISFPEEVEQLLDKRTQMGLVGNMNTYTQFQTANAIGDMAENPGGGGNMMGVLAGVGMGNVVTGAIQGSTQQAQPQAAGGPPPLPQEQWYAGIENKQVGPLTKEQLQQLIQQRKVTKETLLWKQGMENWTAAKDIPETEAMFSSVPPPLTPEA
jgi:membrane protease subunit (stomatin/prohibitin family)